MTALPHAHARLGSGSAEKELCDQVGLRNVRAVAGWNLNRLGPEPLASHPALPIWANRAIFGGDDVRGGKLVAERDALVESGDRQEEPARGQGPVERRLVAVVVEEARSNRGIGRRVLTDPFRIEGRPRMLSHLFAEARVRIGHPGGEPQLVASIERTSCRRQQDGGAGMRDNDGLPRPSTCRRMISAYSSVLSSGSLVGRSTAYARRPRRSRAETRRSQPAADWPVLWMRTKSLSSLDLLASSELAHHTGQCAWQESNLRKVPATPQRWRLDERAPPETARAPLQRSGDAPPAFSTPRSG